MSGDSIGSMNGMIIHGEVTKQIILWAALEGVSPDEIRAARRSIQADYSMTPLPSATIRVSYEW